MVAIVYMVAGLSSRFQGRIKQFARITDNETLIEYSLKQALSAGFNKIIFIVGEKTKLPFKEKFGSSYKNIPVFYALQQYNQKERDRPWGTVDALCSALHLLKEPFIVCNGDDIYGENSFKFLFNHLIKEKLKNKYEKNKENATLGYKLEKVLPETGKVNRGIFKIENSYITGIEEIFNVDKINLAEKNLILGDMCSMNIFALFPETINKLDEILKQFKEKYKNDRKIECLLPVKLSNLIKNKEIVMKIYPTDDRWYGITNPEDEIIVREKLKENL